MSTIQRLKVLHEVVEIPQSLNHSDASLIKDFQEGLH